MSIENDEVRHVRIPNPDDLASNVGHLLVLRAVSTRINGGNHRKIIEEEIPEVLKNGGAKVFADHNIPVIDSRESATFAARHGLTLSELAVALEEKIAGCRTSLEGLVLGINDLGRGIRKKKLVAAEFDPGLQKEINAQRANVFYSPPPKIRKIAPLPQHLLFGIIPTEKLDGTLAVINNPLYVPVGVIVHGAQVMYAEPRESATHA
jgi:hypothetical protein